MRDRSAWLVVAVGWGAFSGYMALAIGPIGLLLVLGVLALGMKAASGGFEHLGAFLLGFGLSGTAILGRVLMYAQQCGYQNCTSPSTFPVFLAFLALGASGLGLLLALLVSRKATGKRLEGS